MVAEIFGGIAAFKSLIDSVKTLKEINDTTARAVASSDLTAKIFALQAEYAILQARVSELEKELMRFERWDAEKARYELESLPPGVLVYRVKEVDRGAEPFHRICADCYNKGFKSLLHSVSEGNGLTRWRCHVCGFDVMTGNFIEPRRPDDEGWR